MQFVFVWGRTIDNCGPRNLEPVFPTNPHRHLQAVEQTTSLRGLFSGAQFAGLTSSDPVRLRSALDFGLSVYEGAYT